MIQQTRALVRRWLDALLHIDDTPERTAAAFAVGVFFGFSPFLGLHTILGLAAAFLLKLNRIAVVLGIYSNVPWIIGAYYAFTTWLGALLLHGEVPDNFQDQLADLLAMSVFTRAFWQEVVTILRPLLWSFVVGSTLGALVLALVAYRAALGFVQLRRHRKHHRHSP
jgi:uncharacterized protein (DUF2062 family)